MLVFKIVSGMLVFWGVTTVVKCRACVWVEENNYGHAMDVTRPSYAMPNKLANA